jgi:hypothetical protein
LAEGLLQIESLQSPGGFVQGRRWLLGTANAVEEVPVFRRRFVQELMIVVKHGWCRCVAKHHERTHVKFQVEASLRRGGG